MKIVYYSGSGNTEKMANLIAEGIKEEGKWGDGQWMRDWQDRVESLGCTLIDDGLIINYEPEDNSPECINFGKEIAKA